jgi:hypothetical protein
MGYKEKVEEPKTIPMGLLMVLVAGFAEEVDVTEKDNAFGLPPSSSSISCPDKSISRSSSCMGSNFGSFEFSRFLDVRISFRSYPGVVICYLVDTPRVPTAVINQRVVRLEKRKASLLPSHGTTSGSCPHK